ncbi:MAG: peptide ABC transporter substrate-binding protein [Chloroflexi bacterium]|nr:MAG: peptide ABC transporter substrate-binding protein [Chloroflexota bacterium]TMG50431.1 MAG: peptide ABC transporter substrate-binding protein [Chloroflexota bacterium]
MLPDISAITRHRRPRWRLRLSVFGASALVLLVACAPGNSNSPTSIKPGGKVTVASWQEQDSLLSCNITAASTHACAYINPAMEGLLTVKANQDPLPNNPKVSDYWVPELAVEVPTLENGGVKTSGDKMDVTWKLRHGVKWHDGVPFTSKDVKATFEFWWLKYRDKNPTPLVSTSGWDQVESVETPDDYTAIVHFHIVYAAYLTLGTGPYGILPDHLLQQVWAKTGNITTDKVTVNIPGGYNGSDTLDKVMVGTGPFMFKEWVTGDHLTLTRNPHWWGGGGRPYLNEIRVKFDTDANQELNELRTNAIDMGLDLRPSLLPPLSRLSDVTTVTILDSASEHIDINLHNTFLKDVTLRKAILMGIDRQKIVDTLLLGKTVVPPDAWMCIQTGAWCLDPNAKHSPYDPAAANKLLDDAGYKLQDSGDCKGFRADPQGRCVRLHLVTTTLPLREEQEVVIASDLQSIGIDILKPFANVPSSRMFGSCTAGGVIYSHNFDLALYTNNYSYPAEPDSLAYTAYHSSQIPTDVNGCVGQNTTYLSDPQLDQALDQARLSVRLSERKDKYIAAQRRLADLIPEIPLYQAVDVEAYNKKLGGYKGNEFWWMNQTADWYTNQ